ncbi:hypothetical protein BY996DRAFT_6439164 [Phakopsora pachyrhizi]|nr:hypothetical protein BY996DRAFT_6439164 [Phakopsora pachyrhizi]
MEFEDRLKSSGAVYQEVRLARSFDSMRGEPEDHSRVRRKDEWPHSEEKTKRTSEAPASGRDRVLDHNDKRNSAWEIVTGKIWLHWFEGQTTVKVAWQTTSFQENLIICEGKLERAGMAITQNKDLLGRGGINGGVKGGSEEQGRMDSSEVNQEEEEMVKEELVLKPRRMQSHFRDSDQSRILNLRQMTESATVGEFWRWSELFKAIDGVEDVFRPTHKGMDMNKGFRGLRQDKDSTKIKGQKSRRYRIKRLRTIRKKSRAVEQDRGAENSGKESIGVKKSPTKARSFISLNNKSIIKE